MAKKIIGICALILLFCACEKPEKPVKPYDRGTSIESAIPMGEHYEYQLYYNLDQNIIIKQNLKTDWDFAISTTDRALVLNTSRNMLAAKSSQVDLALVKDTVGLSFKMDFPSGDRDSLAIGILDNSNSVYVIWLGYSIAGDDLGYIKVQFKWISEDQCQFTYGDLGSNVFKTSTIALNSDYNHVFYSFMHNQAADIEPIKTSYDLHFTQYLHFFLEPEITPYLVAGVLLNPYQTEVERIANTPYNVINASRIATSNLSSRPDIIGYDWKGFSLSKNAYTVVPDLNFLIKDQKGFYYKLRFVDFYNDQGIRGTPKFQFVKL